MHLKLSLLCCALLRALNQFLETLSLVEHPLQVLGLQVVCDLSTLLLFHRDLLPSYGLVLEVRNSLL